MNELPKDYDHKISEKKWQEYWEHEATYRWRGKVVSCQLSVKREERENLEKITDNQQPATENFVIDTPPPTVSGLLHMGHIFSYTQADFVARYQRMKGKDVFYPMGFDDNGLPTERLVEKVKNIRAVTMPREEFIKQCESVVGEAEEEFRRLFKSAALSVDWSREYQTISPQSRKLSQLSFLDLMKKNEAYRKMQPMLWDPVDQTAIAQAEVEDKEMASFENYIPFGLVDENVNPSEIKWAEIEKLTIMTTRPELLAACVALMCHPDDAKKYKGKKAVTPLFGVVVPIVADAKVDKEKGTGLVMCCTFGDETDIGWWREHNLPMRVILNKQGRLDLSGDWLKPVESRAYCSVLDKKIEALNGLKVSNNDPKHPGARQKTIELLKETGCLLEQKPISHAVKCAERSGAPLEFIPTAQWFVKILDKKEALIEKARECNWKPDYMRLRIEQWINGLSWDWCISRQRYFGVPFPVWYSKRAGEEGKILLADPADLPVNPLVDLPRGYSKDEVEPDQDVMDTWATSSISPQLSSKAINQDFAVDYDLHKQLFPADLRPQAHEIIRTWAFYTIVKAHLHENTIPWKNLMISGWCLAADKTKMSKSKGNVITPVALIEEKGTDAVRYWASTSRLGADTAFSEDLLKIGRKLVTKLWNAAKFAAVHLNHIKEAPKSAKEDVESGLISEPLDQWILTKLGKAVDKATKQFEEFEYCDARIAAEDFFWNDFCDNYLEMVKVRAYGQLPVASCQLSEKENTDNRQPTTDNSLQLSAAYTIHHCLDGILKLFAPFVPHITEELYSFIFADKFKISGSIHAKDNWPSVSSYPLIKDAEEAGIEAVSILNAVRKLKADQKISLKTPLEVIHIGKKEGAVSELLKKIERDLKGVTNSEKIIWQSGTGDFLEALSEDSQFMVQAKVAKDANAA